MEELNRAAAIRIEAGRPDYRAGGQRAPRPVSGGADRRQDRRHAWARAPSSFCFVLMGRDQCP